MNKLIDIAQHRYFLRLLLLKGMLGYAKTMPVAFRLPGAAYRGDQR